jgi:hypothetical protein
MRGVLIWALLLASPRLCAQSAGVRQDIADFVAATRAATSRYQDQRVALQDGYRRIGPDFPSMGEHWLNRTLVMRAEVDPARPPILEYILVNGQPVLAGVAFAKLVYGAAPESPIPAPPSAWHYHAGSVDEESFIASHAAQTNTDSAVGPRIAVLHAWIWTENPAGLFATDNWALPWLRLDMDPPASGAKPDSLTLMAALAAGGEHYFSTMLRLRYFLDPSAADRVAEILRTYAAWLRTGQRTPEELAQAWPAMEKDLQSVCSMCSLKAPRH